jgi:hypothetical protein
VTSSRSSKKQQPRGDYEVGYARTPVSGRYKLGDVGNPKGRPKKMKTVGQIIDDAMMMRIKVEENGRSRTVTAQELIIFNLVRLAARSDLRAIRALFALRDHYHDSSDTTLNPSDLEAEDRKIIEEHLAELRRQESKSETAKDESSDQSGSDKGDQNPDDTEDKAS